jgi:hypothetical protein
VKDEQPVIPVSHGQSSGHWLRDGDGRPFLNLEDLWADYEHSVERFIEHLRERADRRTVGLERFRERGWRVGMVTISPGNPPAAQPNIPASVASSMNLMQPPLSCSAGLSRVSSRMPRTRPGQTKGRRASSRRGHAIVPPPNSLPSSS